MRTLKDQVDFSQNRRICARNELFATPGELFAAMNKKGPTKK